MHALCWCAECGDDTNITEKNHTNTHIHVDDDNTKFCAAGLAK